MRFPGGKKREEKREIPRGGKKKRSSRPSVGIRGWGEESLSSSGRGEKVQILRGKKNSLGRVQKRWSACLTSLESGEEKKKTLLGRQGGKKRKTTVPFGRLRKTFLTREGEGRGKTSRTPREGSAVLGEKGEGGRPSPKKGGGGATGKRTRTRNGKTRAPVWGKGEKVAVSRGRGTAYSSGRRSKKKGVSPSGGGKEK